MNCRCGLEGTYTRPGQNSLDNGKVDYISSLHRYGPPRRTKPVLVNMAVLQCPGLSWHYTHVCVLYTLVGDRKHRPSCYALTRLGGSVFFDPRGHRKPAIDTVPSLYPRLGVDGLKLIHASGSTSRSDWIRGIPG